MLKKLYIDNYKSFCDTEIEFGQFNCLIGPNNAGKSNLIDALEFLDIAIFADIDKAVKDKGGFDKIKNYRTDSNIITIRAEFTAELIGCFGFDLISSEHTIKVQLSIKRENETNTFVKDLQIDGKLKHLRLKESEFHFGAFGSISVMGTSKFEDLYNSFEQLFEQIDIGFNKFSNIFTAKRNKQFELNYNQINEKRKINIPDSQSADIKNLLNKLFEFKNSNNTLQLHNIFCAHDSLFDSYFFAPSQIRHQRINDNWLNKDGTSLVNYLSILKENRNNALEKISYSLIGEIEVASGIDSTTVGGLPELSIIENMPNGEFKNLNIAQASEGTIHFIAIMTALVASEHSIIMIEEPERSLHMKMLSYITEQCRTNKKQIFITTHSSELLKMLKPQEISFVYRDRNGNSKVKMASKIPYLKKMMQRTKYDIVELIQTGIIGNFEDDE